MVETTTKTYVPYKVKDMSLAEWAARKSASPRLRCPV